MIETTTGRVLFNQIVPKKIPFMNELLKKKKLTEIIGIIYNSVGNLETSKFLDDLKEIGFKFATLGGLSVNIDDIEVPKTKDKIIEEAYKRVEVIYYFRNERYNKVIDIWTHMR
jgi:DNA-directed RNA polymerase subunit beta'